MNRYEEIKEILINTGWYPETLELAIRAKFKCEYCDKDFLESPDNYYDFQIDHIVPKKILIDESFNNKAIACKTCNFIKRSFDPRENGIDANDRESLLLKSKSYIQSKRSKKQEMIEEERVLVTELLRNIV